MTEVKTRAPARERRSVSNDEFNRAYRGVPGDEASLRAAADNRNVIKGVLRKYSKQLTKDELFTCGLNALWRTLQYHRDCFNQKFTTSLHRFTDWECKRELRKKRGGRGRVRPVEVPFADMLNIAARDNNNTNFKMGGDPADDDLRHVTECIDLLDDDTQKQVIRQYYFEHLTMEQIGRVNGYSKETARKNLRSAVDALREVALVTLGD